MSSNEPGIFISYSRKDEQFARKLTTSLAGLGANVWLDVKDIPAGVNWSQAIQRGLSDCRLMILIVTPDSMNSPNVANEWQYYLDTGKAVIPVLLRPATMHFQINRLQRIDFSAGADYQTAVGQLAAELGKHGVGFRHKANQQGAAGITYNAVPSRPKPRSGRTALLGIAGLFIVACLVAGFGLAFKFLIPTATPPLGAASLSTTLPAIASPSTLPPVPTTLTAPPTFTPIVISPPAFTVPAAATVDAAGTAAAQQSTAAQQKLSAQQTAIEQANHQQETLIALSQTAAAHPLPTRPPSATPTATPTRTPPNPVPQTDACLQDNVIQMATNASYPPFESLDAKTGSPVGFDISLMQYVARLQGYQLVLINDLSDTNTLLSSVAGDKYDAAISAIKMGVGLSAKVAFSDPYLTSGLSVVIRRGDKYQTVNDVQGATIGVQKGTYTENIAASAFFKSKRIPYQYPSDAMKDLIGKNIDAVMVDLPFADYYLHTYPTDLAILGSVTMGDQYVIAVQPGCKMLLDKINIGLKELMSSDNYRKMVISTFGVDAPGGVLQ